MTIRINNIKLDLDDDIEVLKESAAKKLRLNKSFLKDFKILRESIDARKKEHIKLNYAVLVKVENEFKLQKKLKDKDIIFEKEENILGYNYGSKKLKERPIIIGMGPAGMFAGLIMAKNGYKPIIFERGEKVEERTKTVEDFWKGGKLKEDTNVQFGEGGAGTFSDGKLTTRIKDKRCDLVLEELIKGGAPSSIAYLAKAHVGTDILKVVVKNIRKEIEALGGEVFFKSKLQDIKIKDNKLKSIVVNGEEIPCENLILSIGHSARDTYEMLYKRGVFMTPKSFSIGVRIEHKRKMIDYNQYGRYAEHKKLRAADYKLTYNSKLLNRGIYSFCMCPGGQVVAASSEQERLVTNGMSYYKRDEENSNSALVVTVSKEDFKGDSPLCGMEFQRYYEGLAFKLGGGNYHAPIQLVGDFLKDEKSKAIGSIEPSYKPGYRFSMLKDCLPSYVVDGLKEGLLDFDRKIKGFAERDAVLTGIETRTSAPVRIERNEKFQSINLSGLYPAGEGAGFAGGIISAAVDGIKAAEKIMEEWSPFI